MILAFDNSYGALDLKSLCTEANLKGKNLMVVFTRREWCYPCVKFDKEVLNDTSFKDFAKKSLIILEIDRKANKSFCATIDGINLKLSRAEIFDLQKN